MREVIRSMTNEKAVGLDSLPVKLLNINDPVIMSHFHSILSTVWSEREVPPLWNNNAATKVLPRKKDRPDQ